MMEVYMDRKRLGSDFLALVLGGLPLTFCLLIFLDVIYADYIIGIILGVVSLITVPLTSSLRKSFDGGFSSDESVNCDNCIEAIITNILFRILYFAIIPFDFVYRLFLVLGNLGVKVDKQTKTTQRERSSKRPSQPSVSIDDIFREARSQQAQQPQRRPVPQQRPVAQQPQMSEFERAQQKIALGAFGAPPVRMSTLKEDLGPEKYKKIGEAKEYNIKASQALDHNNIDETIINYTKAFEIYKELELADLILTAASSIGGLHLQKNDKEKAVALVEELKPLLENNEDTFGAVSFYGLIAKLFITEEKYEEALDATAKGSKVLIGLKKVGVTFEQIIVWISLFPQVQKQIEELRSTILKQKRGELNSAQKKADSIVEEAATLMRSGNIARAVDKFKEAFKIYRENSDAIELVSILPFLTTLLASLGSVGEALEIAQISLELALQTDIPYLKFMSHQVLGTIQANLRQIPQATENLEKALEWGEDLLMMDIFFLSSTYFSLGNAYMMNKEYDKAITYFEKSAETANGSVNPEVIAKARLMKGQCHFICIDFENSIKELEESLKIVEKLNTYPDLIECLYWLGQAYEYGGRLDDAIVIYERGEKACLESQITGRLAEFSTRLKYGRENQLMFKRQSGEESEEDKQKTKSISDLLKKLETMTTSDFNWEEYRVEGYKFYDSCLDTAEHKDKATPVMSDLIQLAKLNDSPQLTVEALFKLGILQFKMDHLDQAEKTLKEAEQIAVSKNFDYLLTQIRSYLKTLAQPRQVTAENTIYIDVDSNKIISDKSETARIFEKNKNLRAERYTREAAQSSMKLGEIYLKQNNSEIALQAFQNAKIYFAEISEEKNVKEAEEKIKSID
ncbi:MAG: tetratricopeptide repeat protein [Candidatus Heimdallarchaeota archaeon]|nr:tetratricopeptide repeat protein [Candidatus Heimdallarchaeota archaeon]